MTYQLFFACVCVVLVFHLCLSYASVYGCHSSVGRICPVGVCVTILACVLLALVSVLCVQILFASIWRVCVPNLSCRGLCDQFTFHPRVFNYLHLSRYSVGRFYLRLCTNVMNLAVRRSPIRVCVTNLWFTSAWRVCVTRLCDKCYESGCVPRSYRGLCDQFMIYVCMTSLCDKSVWQMLCVWLCAEVQSGSVTNLLFILACFIIGTLS